MFTVAKKKLRPITEFQIEGESDPDGNNAFWRSLGLDPDLWREIVDLPWDHSELPESEED